MATRSSLPFRDGSFAGAYATWPYFFSREWDPTPGIDELHRVVTAGGPLVIVDNLDGDDFSDERRALHVGPGVLGARKGFEVEEIETAFAFDTHEQVDRLLGFYFGDAGCGTGKLEFFYRVGVYVGPSRGSDR